MDGAGKRPSARHAPGPLPRLGSGGARQGLPLPAVLGHWGKPRSQPAQPRPSSSASRPAQPLPAAPPPCSFAEAGRRAPPGPPLPPRAWGSGWGTPGGPGGSLRPQSSATAPPPGCDELQLSLPLLPSQASAFPRNAPHLSFLWQNIQKLLHFLSFFFAEYLLA